jgi:hypothetical protein
MLTFTQSQAAKSRSASLGRSARIGAAGATVRLIVDSLVLSAGILDLAELSRSTKLPFMVPGDPKCV